MKNYKLHNQTLTERVINIMLLSIMIAVVVYCIILLSVVFSVIERKQNNLAIRDLKSTLSYAESSYANEVSKIDDGVLALNNFKRVDGSFVVRKDEAASFALLYAR